MYAIMKAFNTPICTYTVEETPDLQAQIQS